MTSLRESPSVPDHSTSRNAVTAVIIFFAAHFALLVGVTTPEKFYFDEVHYAPAARQAACFVLIPAIVYFFIPLYGLSLPDILQAQRGNDRESGAGVRADARQQPRWLLWIFVAVAFAGFAAMLPISTGFVGTSPSARRRKFISSNLFRIGIT